MTKAPPMVARGLWRMVAIAYNSSEIFEEVYRRLSANPGTHLYELARQLGCSHPTIEKAVREHTSLTFRDYQKKLRVEMGVAYLGRGYKPREIGSLLGYRWPENFLHLVKVSTGCSLMELVQNDKSVTRKTSRR